jgi:hypothetical protein
MNEKSSSTSSRWTWWFANAGSLLYLVVIVRFFGKNPLVVAFFLFLLVGALAVFWRIVIRVKQTHDRGPWVHST